MHTTLDSTHRTHPLIRPSPPPPPPFFPFLCVHSVHGGARHGPRRRLRGGASRKVLCSASRSGGHLFSPTHPFLPYVAPHFSHISHFNLVFQPPAALDPSASSEGLSPEDGCEWLRRVDLPPFPDFAPFGLWRQKLPPMPRMVPWGVQKWHELKSQGGETARAGRYTSVGLAIGGAGFAAGALVAIAISGRAHTAAAKVASNWREERRSGEKALAVQYCSS